MKPAVQSIAVLVAVSKGLDPQAPANTWADFVSQVATLAAAAYTRFQAAEMVYGLIRKGLFALSRAA